MLAVWPDCRMLLTRKDALRQSMNVITITVIMIVGEWGGGGGGVEGKQVEA